MPPDPAPKTLSRDATAPPVSASRQTMPQALISVFWAMLVGNLLIVALVYRISVDHERADRLIELQSVAEQKVAAIAAWRQELLIGSPHRPDADTGRPGPAIEHVLRSPASEPQHRPAFVALHRLRAAAGAREILVLTADGRPVVSTAAPSVVHPATQQALKPIATRRQRELLPPYQDDRGRTLSELVTPIHDRQNQLLGFLVSKFDLSDALQESLGGRQAPNHRGETILIASLGGLPIVLSTGDAAQPFLPLPDHDPALQQAAAARLADSFESRDEKNHAVLVATRPVADTDWLLVTRIPLAEALRNSRQLILYLAAGSVLLIVLCGVTVIRLWRLQNDRAARELAQSARNEAALREQLDMLNTLIENVPGGVTLFDRDLRLRFHNRQYQILLDFPDDLFKEKAPHFETFARYNAWRGEYGPGDPERIAAEMVKRASQPDVHIFERERPDGTAVEVRGAPLKGGGFVSIYTDITARRQAEQKQLLSEKIIATSPTAILITDPRNRIVFVNPAFTAITGFSFAEVEGKDPKVLASGRHDKAFYQAFWTTLGQDDHWSGEIWDRRNDGSIYPKWLSVYTLRNPGGRLTNYVAMFTDITDRKQAEQRIHHLAHHDPLTGLANRMALEMRLDQAIAEAARNARKVALLFIDLDRFKTVNDSLGHAVGDLMLIEIAGRLTERLRGSDIVARLGGDEFVVVLPELPDAGHAALVAQTLLEDMARPIKTESAELHTSGSIGIAIFPDDGGQVDALMQSADTAMYEAKSAGRNAFRFFTREMTDSANHRLQLENDLRSAIIKEQFELHYQPQVVPADGRIVGVEALLRWRHPTNGMVGPDRFIPVAEETGLIVDIGAWVLREGCRQARQWIDAGFAIRMSINLSARQLRSDNLLSLIESTLAEYRLPTHALELEITESALMERPEQAVTLLNAIKAMGVALALDDFGTGYSSLAYLKRFPIDRLKIDRSFVSDIDTDPNDRAIALSTIALAHSLGLEVTAEGVEETAQRDFLREHGCDDAQGWYYSKAVPAAAAEVLLRKGYLP